MNLNTHILNMYDFIFLYWKMDDFHQLVFVLTALTTNPRKSKQKT